VHWNVITLNPDHQAFFKDKGTFLFVQVLVKQIQVL
jgi:hypothetical protein